MVEIHNVTHEWRPDGVLTLECPVISPVEVPVLRMNACPNLDIRKQRIERRS
jgi:hypothetical protein